jgi:hypothetical protein
MKFLRDNDPFGGIVIGIKFKTYLGSDKTVCRPNSNLGENLSKLTVISTKTK